MAATHEVLNQPPPLADYNLFTADRALVEALRREGAAWAEQEVSACGLRTGSAEVIQWGFQANDNKPILRTHDRFGHRIDEVEYHPAWHSLMALAVEHGVHAAPWADPKGGAHVARAAKMLIGAQNEQGHGCPISMTYAVLPALRKQPDLAHQWEALVESRVYDSRFIPAREKRGALMGMAMTEKQGGSDVRANTTRAVPINGGGPGKEYSLTGHKWFCSAPMCDAFLVLAQAPGGLSCFLLPRWLPDGTRNRFFIQRLKDKLGNRSNASSEIELDDAHAWLVAEEGRGVHTIVEMVNHTRLDCALGATGMMRAALSHAIHHCEHRAAFGRKLIEQPLMQNVLADLAIESEAATTLVMRLARAFDRRDDESEVAFRRIGTAVSKYWVCKRVPSMVVEALECLGGNGYVEESITARLHREAPLNSIWEGSGNVICLDVLRAMAREPRSVEALIGEIRSGAGADRRFDAFVAALEADFPRTPDPQLESRARRFVGRLALALQGSLLLRHAPPAIADAFCASRLAGDWGHAFGTLSPSIDVQGIIDRARPHLE